MMENDLAALQQTVSCTDTGCRYFSPDDIHAFEAEGGYRLTIKNECTYIAFSAVLTHPVSLPESYISLLDGTREIGILRDLSDFDEETQTVIRKLLADRYFVPKVRRIVSRRELHSGIVWQVETDRGPRIVVTRSIYESVWQNSDGRYFMIDLDENRYEIRTNELTRHDAAWIEDTIS